MKKLFLWLSIVLFWGCKDSYQPKPKAFLRLDYGENLYDSLISNDFSFQKNQKAQVVVLKKNNFNLEYPKMKATIHITYKPVENNLKNLLKDAQKLTYEHTVKASNIIEQPYIDETNRIFGMFYEVDGNAASQSQFYLTDSVSHFLTGSVYFKVKPNFDSIQPAASYLKKDLKEIIETIRWNFKKK